MARFKPIHKGLKLLPVDFDRQVIPGSFEHALCHLVDHALDLTTFHKRYHNDVEGAPAFDPAVLIKIILLAYSRGIIHSRKIEAACRETVLFIAISGDSQPHFTTLAAFVSGMGDSVAKLFAQILLICDRQGLIGREMFAIDGVKLPSDDTVITADAGYHSKANLKAMAEQNINAYIPDNGYRQRDERYADQCVHAAKPDPLWNKAKHVKQSKCFKPADFRLAEDHSHCVCPAGKQLYGNGSNCTINGYAVMKFSGAKQDCVPCQRRAECLRTPEKTSTRQSPSSKANAIRQKPLPIG